MGYTLLWIESLTAALLGQVLVTACAARWPRFPRNFTAITLFVVFLSLAVALSAVLALLQFAARIPAAPFPGMSAWTMAFALGGIWILRTGLKRRSDDVPAARDWPRGRLALATVAALVVDGGTFTNMDLATKIHLIAVRAEARTAILELIPPAVADRDNAAPLYLDAVAALVPSDKLPASWTAKQADWLNLDRSKWKPDDPDLAEFLAAQKRTLSLLRQAAALPACSFDRSIPDFTKSDVSPQAQLPHCARLLALAAIVKAAHGDAAGAANDLVAIRGIARHLAAPTFMAVLQAASVEKLAAETLEEVLALLPLAAADLDRLTFGRDDSYRKKMARALRMDEVASGLSCFSLVAGEDFADRSETDRDATGAIFKMLPRSVWRVFFLREDLAAYRRRMHELESLTAKPYYEARQGWQAERQSFRTDRGGFVTYEIVPAAEKLAYAATEADAARQLSRLALAAAAYRNQTGRLPAHPEELTPAYLDQMPTDPFDGRPLRMTPDGEGLILYSVGPDMTDDAARAYNPADKTGDILFRLRPPSARKAQ
jgi:hypothetical protein